MINLTSQASNKIQQSLTKRGKGIGIRFGIRTTGCSGLSYVLEYVDTINPDDVEFSSKATRIFVDPKSLVYLDGMTVDYVKQGLNEGFEFINPNVKDECGCGESFRV